FCRAGKRSATRRVWPGGVGVPGPPTTKKTGPMGGVFITFFRLFIIAVLKVIKIWAAHNPKRGHHPKIKKFIFKKKQHSPQKKKN
ncbi:hypothetical protein, partial [Enterobacter hormaechei]